MLIDGIYDFGHGPTSESVQKADMLTRKSTTQPIPKVICAMQTTYLRLNQNLD